jgi:hypothetical protein
VRCAPRTIGSCPGDAHPRPCDALVNVRLISMSHEYETAPATRMKSLYRPPIAQVSVLTRNPRLPPGDPSAFATAATEPEKSTRTRRFRARAECRDGPDSARNRADAGATGRILPDCELRRTPVAGSSPAHPLTRSAQATDGRSARLHRA